MLLSRLAVAAGCSPATGSTSRCAGFAVAGRHRASDLASDPLKRFVILHIALGLGGVWMFSARSGLAPEATQSVRLLLVPGLILVTVRIVLELYAVVRPPVQWGSARTRLT